MPRRSNTSIHACVFTLLQHIFKMANVRTSNSLEQEYEKFQRFTDSLISRSGKLSELSQQLESTLAEVGKSEDSPDGKRVAKSDS